MYVHTQQKQTLIHREQTYRYQKKKGGENYEFGIKRYTLLIQKRWATGTIFNALQ